MISQRWAEWKRRILVVTPANLRKHWYQELTEKFALPSLVPPEGSIRVALSSASADWTTGRAFAPLWSAAGVHQCTRKAPAGSTRRAELIGRSAAAVARARSITAAAPMTVQSLWLVS